VKVLDRWLQTWRVRVAAPAIRDGARLLDVGCHDRSLIDHVLPRIASAVGLDPVVAPSVDGRVTMMRGLFPRDAAFDDASFDCIAILATLEHMDDPGAVAVSCHRLLAPGGRVVLTVPHPAVDRILDVLLFLRLADGIDAEEHHGFDVSATAGIYAAAGFRLVRERRFQLGLNRLFVFEKPRDGDRSLERGNGA
jgi:SAM-dependent methyltransferase